MVTYKGAMVDQQVPDALPKSYILAYCRSRLSGAAVRALALALAAACLAEAILRAEPLHNGRFGRNTEL